MAEVDSARLAQVTKKYPNANVYPDWRRMLDKEHKDIDIACIGTPDHMHAPTAMCSMQFGLHVYVQKPLTHDIFEARRLAAMAHKKKLVTQMGIQRHSSREYLTDRGVAKRRNRQGERGARLEREEVGRSRAHARPLGSRSRDSRLGLWLGTAEKRPYLNGYYHPMNWRKRIDFGTATFGDMGCHIYDPIFSALQLTAPITVRSEGPAPTSHNWALNSVIHYVFPGHALHRGQDLNSPGTMATRVRRPR